MILWQRNKLEKLSANPRSKRNEKFVDFLQNTLLFVRSKIDKSKTDQRFSFIEIFVAVFFFMFKEENLKFYTIGENKA